MTLRICHVTTFYPPHNFGGDGITVQRLSRALVARGHEVTVAYDPSAYESLSTAPAPSEPRREQGVEVIELRSRLGKLGLVLGHQLGHPVAHGRQLRELFAARQFDVINFHNVSLVGGPGLLRLGTAIKLYMAHEHWLVCPSHVLWRHNREPCTGRQCLRCVAAYRRPPQLWRYTGALQRAARHIDSFIALSEFSRAKHREFGFTAEFEVLPCFLPDEQAAVAAPATRPHTRPYCLFVGRLERIKGLNDILPAFASGDVDLLVAGDGEQRRELEQRAGKSERIVFLGRQTQAELARYYDHALALVVPTVGFETFGIVLIEAFRQGLPVIARRTGPFPEIVERSGGGELFSTTHELVAALRRLQHDTAHRDRLAQNAYRAYREHWTAEAVVPRYLDIIRRAAIKRSRLDVAERALR